MDQILRHYCIDVLVGLPKNGRRTLCRFLKGRKRDVAVFAERSPFHLRLLGRRYILTVKSEDMLTLTLKSFARKHRGKVLSLYAGTPEMEAFILKNEGALAPFYRLPKGECYDS